MLRDDINNAVKDAMAGKGRAQAVHAGDPWSIRPSRTPTSPRAAKASRRLSDAESPERVPENDIKQRQESVGELYDKGGRAELAAQARRRERKSPSSPPICPGRLSEERRQGRRSPPRSSRNKVA